MKKIEVLRDLRVYENEVNMILLSEERKRVYKLVDEEEIEELEEMNKIIYKGGEIYIEYDYIKLYRDEFGNEMFIEGVNEDDEEVEILWSILLNEYEEV